MPRGNVNDLFAFLAVAREQSFTKAAGKLGVSQAALSYTVRALEERLGVRLLTRTTRSVALTDAGERLFNTAAPRLDEIEAELNSLRDLREKPAGTIRITTGEHPADVLIRPKLEKFLPKYPDIKVELMIDHGLTNIVSERYDAGVRLGEQVAKDMIAVRIGPDVRFAVVASKAYFEKNPTPKTPQDLVGHNCINILLPTLGGVWPWEFEKNGRELKVRVEGQATFNGIFQCVKAAAGGLGVAYAPENLVEQYIAKGQLKRVLTDWCPVWPGFHLYYPSRRQSSPAFALLVEALRYRERK